MRFEDVRIYEINADDYQDHYYLEDFEDFDVGFGPFENGVSGQNHMSETSDFTNDTISGRYSLKIQNYEGRNSARTTPATLRLPTNSEVTVSVKYLVSNGGGYTFSAMEDGEALDSVSWQPPAWAARTPRPPPSPLPPATAARPIWTWPVRAAPLCWMI